MPVYDMKCPRCGKQSTEYDENKWQCLHCSNKFVYKEEPTTYQSQTNVNIQGSSLFDVEPFDSANEKPIEKPFGKFEKELVIALLAFSRKNISARRVAVLLGVLVAAGVLFSVSISDDVESPVPGIIVFAVLLHWYIYRKKILDSGTLKERQVGSITLCPVCKKEHSRYYHADTVANPTSGPVHCKSCGKQFMLLDGKAHAIKH